MRRRFLIVVALIALATPAIAQQSVVKQFRAQYPTPMSKAQIVEMEKDIAAAVHGGLLVKPDGNNCGGYACDIICRSSTELYDILGDSDGAATPQWSRTDNPRGYRCELVTPASGGNTPPPPAPLDLAAIVDKLAELADRLDDVQVALANLTLAAGEQRQALERLEARKVEIPALTFPVYTGKVLGQTITLRPGK